ncbi:MAG: hypothetical protein Q7R52_02940 [archaeon]|nr:hypothetical protein [archaeon]
MVKKIIDFPKKNVYFDPELQEYVETSELNPLGFCINCGSVNRHPDKIGIIFVCKECRRTRLEDVLKLEKAYKKWFSKK